MPEISVPDLRDEQGEYLPLPEFYREIEERRAALRNVHCLKLERGQHFQETDASRDALRRGEWYEALRIFEAERPEVLQHAKDHAEQGIPLHRIRVVEEPITPYIQWELHWLNLRAECGHAVRVLPAAALVAAESDGPVPELNLFGGEALYRVLYTDEGATRGALLFTDPAIVESWMAPLQAMFDAGEDVRSYFDRAVRHLPPPPAA